MEALTTKNGSKNKTWLKNRIENGTIKVMEQKEQAQKLYNENVKKAIENVGNKLVFVLFLYIHLHYNNSVTI